MNILIAYATTEGQTAKICEFCAELLNDAGHTAKLVKLDSDTRLQFDGFDAALLAASVHLGTYQNEFEKFVTTNAVPLGARRTLFLAVSLAAAGDDPQDHADLERIAAEFSERTGWWPGRVQQVAGAFRFTQYDFFKSWALRWIAWRNDEKVDPHADREYTDWAALKDVLADWIA